MLPPALPARRFFAQVVISTALALVALPAPARAQDAAAKEFRCGGEGRIPGGPRGDAGQIRRPRRGISTPDRRTARSPLGDREPRSASARRGGG